MTACPACGSANPTGRGSATAAVRGSGSTAAPAAREERKVVTVLFADLAGFTARAETLDPEDGRAFLLPYYDVLTSEIECRGGHVDRFLGDGVMALFGAPTANEDDAERAVRAALRILERIPGLGLDLHVRLGVNTGPVLFAAGSGGERDDAVTGDAVNTAARLQALAPTDGVVVGEPTYRATAHLFAYEALPPALVKGKAEPVAAFRPTAPLARPPGELRAEKTPFVGRDLELSLGRSLRAGEGHPLGRAGHDRGRAGPAGAYAILGAGIPLVELLTGLGALSSTGWRFAVPPRIRAMATVPVHAFAIVGPREVRPR